MINLQFSSDSDGVETTTITDDEEPEKTEVGLKTELESTKENLPPHNYEPDL